jgi:A/G-specific adenine glycosylase
MSSTTQNLLNWYAQHARQLPWRNHPDPYAIWVSEIMLQQTRVETVIPYFERWMERFPTLEALAIAPLQEVLSAWEGLGYYSRARNLHQAAQVIMEKYAGQIPQDATTLRKLPGIGRYTAGAIASIAFSQDEPALDGNIRRVLARFFNLTEPARSTLGERRLWKLIKMILPGGQAGTYIQALMDLGAMICTPRAPDCPRCPLNRECQALLLGVQEERPVLEPKKTTPHFTVTAAVIQREERVLIAQRPPEGLLGGLWEFPGGKQQDGEDLSACLQREIREELGAAIEVGEPFSVYRHAYTHFKVTLHAFRCLLIHGEPHPVQVADLRWVLTGELKDYPMGKIDRQIARRIVEDWNQSGGYSQVPADHQPKGL